MHRPDSRYALVARGQALPILAIELVLLLVLAGLIADGGYLWLSHRLDQDDLDAAVCGIALGVNVPTEATITISNTDVRGELESTSPTFLLQLVGFREFHYTVRSRCLRPRAQFSPICVKSAWFDGESHTILGAEHPGEQQADDSQGADYVGACLPWIQSQVPNFDPRIFYDPATESQSPNPFKDIYRDGILGIVPIPIPGVGTRIPQVSGVSNHQVVQAVVDAGLVEGDQIAVLEFDGTITVPDPGYAPYENMEIIGYGIYRIDEIGANYLTATMVEHLSFNEFRSAITVQQVPWNWAGLSN